MINFNFHHYTSEKLAYPIYLIGSLKPINLTDYSEEIEIEVLRNTKMFLPFLNLYRGTSLNKISNIIQNGHDGAHLDSSFWADSSFSKVLEYGNIILNFDKKCCVRSFKIRRLSEITEDEFNLLKIEYKFYSKDIANDEVFFSNASDNEEGLRGKIHYEKKYGYNAIKECISPLKAILVMNSGDNWLKELLSKFSEHGIELEPHNVIV